MRVRMLVVVLLVSTLVACTNLTSPARSKKLQPNVTYWLDYAAERRGAIAAPRSTELTVCAEPVPDVALQHTSSFLAKVDVPQSAEGELSTEFASEVVQLAGRTQTVLLLREAMYRLCEQSMNGNLNQSDIKSLFEKVLETTLLFGKADALNAGARLRADPETKKEILDYLGEPNNSGE